MNKNPNTVQNNVPVSTDNMADVPIMPMPIQCEETANYRWLKKPVLDLACLMIWRIQPTGAITDTGRCPSRMSAAKTEPNHCDLPL